MTRNLISSVKTKTSTKLVFRCEDQTEAEEMARIVLPLDLEKPVEALIKPTAVGQDIVRLKNSSAGSNTSTSKGKSVTDALSESYGISYTKGEGTMSAVGHGSVTGQSSGEVMAPDSGLLGVGNPISQSMGENFAASDFASSGKSSFSAVSEGYGIAWTKAETKSLTDTEGTSFTEGSSEALRTVYQDLPSAVHSLQNATYLAARELRTLKDGYAILCHRDLSMKIYVPLAPKTQMTADEIDQAREHFLSLSPFAKPAEDAQKAIEERERSFQHTLVADDSDLSQPEPFLNDPDKYAEGFIGRMIEKLDSEKQAPKKGSKPTLVVSNDDPDASNDGV